MLKNECVSRNQPIWRNLHGDNFAPIRKDVLHYLKLYFCFRRWSRTTEAPKLWIDEIRKSSKWKTAHNTLIKRIFRTIQHGESSIVAVVNRLRQGPVNKQSLNRSLRKTDCPIHSDFCTFQPCVCIGQMENCG
ncbi:hypothetical protein CSKR_100977 [Clonorchis sinensis]|uniref:Uncharacterized protein n=2 Tax=Clonorchis sinensis TaxID=79923 RepID=G7YAF2_CLOSI|nr:hypothetical protein CSKR_100977 [Clonorchis sinensis]GAA49936.1 hypothetical protein CLF_103803 [Clonorchis sinensis]